MQTAELDVVPPVRISTHRRRPDRHRRRRGPGRPRRLRPGRPAHVRARDHDRHVGRDPARSRVATFRSARRRSPAILGGSHDDRRRPAAAPLTVAMLTLGCARNEVDSEELAGRLAADGFRLVDRPRRGRHGRGQHLRLRRAGQEGLRRRAARGRRPQGLGRQRRARPGRRRRRLHGRALRQGPRRVAARGRRRARLRRLRRHRRSAALDRGGGDPPPAHAVRPPAAAADQPGRPPAQAARGRPAAAARVRARWRRSSSRSGCDRRCTLLRDPELPRLVRQPPSLRRARRGPLAGRRGRARAVPGLGELHLLRQGPRRPAAARDAAARAGRASTASSGSASPTCSPPRPGPGLVEAIATTPGVAPYFDLSFQHASATVLRRMRRFGDPDSFLGLLEQVRAHAPRGRRPVQRDRRASPARPRTTCRPCATSSRPPGWT